MQEERMIQLTYRKIIDAAASKPWDKLVWESSWNEYRMQVQFYDQEKRFPLFSELIRQVPAADKLHFLVCASVTGYLRQLEGKVPDVLNSVGRHFLPFNQYRFELIESHTRDQQQHRIAIQFFSEPLYWLDTLGDRLLLSLQQTKQSFAYCQTEMVSLIPFLSIQSLQLRTDDQTIHG